MQYLVTADEMRRYDNNTIERIGIPAFALMERAALKACEKVLKYLLGADANAGNYHHMPITNTVFCKSNTPSILIMAGYGNNGGDGLALARMLLEYGFEVSLWCVGDETKATSLWKKQREILEHYPVTFVYNQMTQDGESVDVNFITNGMRTTSREFVLNYYDVCVDALFGVGLSKEVLGEYEVAIERFNQINGRKLALDVPSGIHADTGRALGACVKADETVTFGFCKRGLVLYPGCIYAGNVEVADIGISQAAFFGQKPGMFTLKGAVKNLLPKRLCNGNKGTFGKVLLVVGSVNMSGAAILAAKAAYRTGAGMVKIISSEENRIIMQEAVPEALFGSEEQLEGSLLWADVIAVGPGLGTDERAHVLLQKVLTASDKPLVVDADGLNILSADENMKNILAKQSAAGRAIIMTPHVGELARLVGKTRMECLADGAYKIGEIAYEMACSLHSIIVAKDARTFVCKEGNAIFLNSNGNSGMATAGSGDVLTGIIVALLGQGMEAYEAAVTGVYLHAAAGDAVAVRLGERSCMAGDIAEAIAEICK